MNIRKDDQVQVITGNSKGKVGRVLRIVSSTGKVVVEGVNVVYKHTKPSQRSQQGGRITKEMPMFACNVQVYCATCRKGVRVGRRFSDKGQKERYCKKCGGSLGKMGPEKAAYAKK